MASSSALFLLSTLFFHSYFHYEIAHGSSERKTLEIHKRGSNNTNGSAPAPSFESKVCHCAFPPPPPPPPSQPRPTPPPSPPHPPPTFENKHIQQAYYVIQAFKKRVQHDPQGITKTWKGYNVCRYTGFRCDYLPNIKKKTRALAAVDFNGNQLGGSNFSLFDFLEKLEDLAIFHANSNSFAKNVPNDITKLMFVYELDLSNNKLSGGFPSAVLGTNLTFLDIRFNELSGNVPPKVFNLPLEVLFINNNNFDQRLPDNLGSTPASYITFANNKFSGPIPSSIGRARKTLIEVLFLNNKFSGCLPYEIGLLNQAELFDVSRNQLTGPIPKSFQCLDKMELLNLAQNKFYGPVPEEVCKLPNLTKFSLSNNYFNRAGPACRKLINAKMLDVTKNCILDLPNQRRAAECKAFYSTIKRCPKEKLLQIVPCRGRRGTKSKSQPVSEAQKRSSPISRRAYNALVPPPVMP